MVTPIWSNIVHAPEDARVAVQCRGVQVNVFYNVLDSCQTVSQIFERNPAHDPVEFVTFGRREFRRA